MPPSYQPIATRFRPQRFSEVLGQQATVQTLLSALRSGRLGNAYLFSGSRGTGKTTLARLLAKALNCIQPTKEGEPCCACTPCLEIARGQSLCVLEIDGASHRSIDDIRQIRETVSYTASGGRFKVYILDEVHMLTKEAFNALLKTLEEPPAHVKFLFATTEPHKLPSTVISRCHRFQLRRITPSETCAKLRQIAQLLEAEVEEEALLQIAMAADGGLRDAESLFDQVLSFHGNRITVQAIAEVLGTTPQETFFRLDHAMLEENLALAFEVAQELFGSGRDCNYFIEGLIHHVRTHLLMHCGAMASEDPTLPEEWLRHYQKYSSLFDRTQLLTLFDDLVEQQQLLRTAPSQRISLEVILLRFLRTRNHLSREQLVQRLLELEGRLRESGDRPPTPIQAQSSKTAPPPPLPPSKPVPPLAKPTTVRSASPPPDGAAGPIAPPPEMLMGSSSSTSKEKSTKGVPIIKVEDAQKQNQYNTLLRFAAVELEGTVRNK